jgi:3D (Asp-Asp-Asp) domain-containing protein
MRRLALALVLLTAACVETRGSKWMAEPLPADDFPPMGRGASPAPPRPEPRASELDLPTEPPPQRRPGAEPAGRRVGTFRNTYYDFPREDGFDGAATPIMSASCQPIAQVPRGFHDAVCVQGSGRLKSGTTVSFAKRDCECAEICPRSGQKICFEALDARKFPFGRGSLGQPVTPMVTVAVDPSVVPLGTPIYLAAFDGIETSNGVHDGCFLAEDRGVKVVGDHVDIFTGDPKLTRLLESVVPSNKGVEVQLDVPKCSRLKR